MCAWFVKNNVESKMPLQYRTGDPVLTAKALVLGYLRFAALAIFAMSLMFPVRCKII